MKTTGSKKRASKKAATASAPTPPCGQSVRLRLADTPASAVFVAGTFNDWNPSATAMTAGNPGEWTVDLVLPAGRYEYLFVVDGQWQPDPACAEQVPNPYGGLNCVLEIRAQ